MGGEDWGFCYALPCQYDFLPEDRPVDAFFLLSGEDVPLDCCLWENAPAEKRRGLLERSVLLTRSPELMARQGLGPENCRFVCAAAPGELSLFGADDGEIAAFLREEGEFLPFREYGWRERRFGPGRCCCAPPPARPPPSPSGTRSPGNCFSPTPSCRWSGCWKNS